MRWVCIVFPQLALDGAQRVHPEPEQPLALLAGAPHKVFTRDEILAHLRGHETEIYTRAIDILVSRIRRKLEPLDCIKTLRNAGYAFAAGVAP